MHNQLPNKYYFISKFNKINIDKQDKETAIIYRNYVDKIDKDLIFKLKNYCKKKGNKFLIANNIKLEINLNLDGAYIPSFNKNVNHLSYNLKKKFILIGSAHNLEQIKIKELQGVEAIFLSSIFKKNSNYLGIYKFKLLSLSTTKKIIALGGLSTKNLKKLNLIDVFGFSGISFFE